MGNWLTRRTGVVARDALKYSRVVRGALAAASLAKSLVATGPASVAHLIRAAQYTGFGPLRRYEARKLRAAFTDPDPAAHPDYTAAWKRFLGGGTLTRSIILKAPADGERGVLLLTAEYNWVKFLSLPGVAALAGRYHLVLSAGWSPLDANLVGLAARHWPGPIFLEIANLAEAAFVESLHPRARCLPTICSEWINPALLRPRPPAERDVDLVMVANWAPFKRHWHLFQALARMPRDLRVTLIGQPDGPFTLDRIKQQAADHGVPQEIRYLESLRVEQVYEVIARARAAVILSRQEGTCVFVSEAMVADTPIGMLHDAHIGSRGFINPRTGVLLRYGTVAEQLTEMLAHRDRFGPREWAEANISCHVSLAKWNRFFRDYAKEVGEPWTRDLAPFCWKPYTMYLSADDRAAMGPAFEELRAAYPQAFAADFLPAVVDVPEFAAAGAPS